MYLCSHLSMISFISRYSHVWHIWLSCWRFIASPTFCQIPGIWNSIFVFWSSDYFFSAFRNFLMSISRNFRANRLKPRHHNSGLVRFWSVSTVLNIGIPKGLGKLTSYFMVLWIFLLPVPGFILRFFYLLILLR